MLSIGPINVKTAEHYYEMDDYYAKEDQLGSQWYGKGAEALGFTGAVQKEKFLSLLDGKLPNGQQLGCVRGGKLEHRNGLDLTFSAPKSVSILAELGADNRLFTVHEKAVKATLDYLEKHVIQTRARAGGEIQFVNTQSLVAALFQHDTSRNLDPQLHTHCVVMNATQMENGPWRSLSNEQIYDTKMALGALYRAQLAYELTRLGYSLETKQDALFEIKGVPQNLMEAMSTRRQEIESAIEKFGFKGAAGAAKATLNTRKNKQAIEREALKPTWQAMAKEYGFHPESIIPKGPLLNKKEVKLEEIAKASLLSAAQHLTERESQFTWGDLMRSAAHYGFGKVAIAELEQAFQSQLHRKAFIAMEYKGNRGEQRYTTKEQILHETEVRMLMQQGKNTCQPLLSEITAHAALKSSMLNVKQYQAAFGVLTNTDRVVGIQGYAGVGKTHLLNAVRESVSSNFHTFIGLSPSAAAANELQRNTSITSQTVDAFLLNPKTHLSEKTQDKATQTILVVDEASMLSTQKLSGLLKTAKANDWRVVFVGDMQQLQSVEAGKPFAELQKAGMQIWVVDAIVRQKNESLKAAIYDSIHKDIEAAFSKIGKHVIETSAKDIHEKAAQHWLKFSPEEREQTAVIVPDVAGRKVLNEHIRAGLQKEEILSGEQITSNILVSRGLTREQKAHAKHYQIGDVVLFNKKYKSIGARKSEYYSITHIDRERNKLKLQSRGGQIVEWQPHRLAARRAGIVEVYSPETRALQVGDKIRWSKNHKTEGRINAEHATIMVVNGKTATVKLTDHCEKELDLNQSKYQHWDYAYAHTAHAIQGATVEKVIALLNSQHALLTNPRTFYVEISRARQEAFLYVDDKSKVIAQLQKLGVEKTAALNGVGNAMIQHAQEIFQTPDTKTLTLESKLNQAWSNIYKEPTNATDNLWQKTTNWINAWREKHHNPIETWKTKDSNLSLAMLDTSKSSEQRSAQQTSQAIGNKQKSKDFGLEI